MKLGIRREGGRVVLTVELFVPGEGWFAFAFVNDRQVEHDGALLVAAAREGLAEHLRKLRAMAYADGYRDGRAKRGKASWFSGGWT